MKSLLVILLLTAALPVSAAQPVKRAAPKRLDAKRPAARKAPEPAVTLDVKDADVREIFKSMQQQCGIRNLVLDPDVKGSGTFFFTGVPCSTAFNTVFRSLGLTGVTYSKSLISVGSGSH